MVLTGASATVTPVEDRRMVSVQIEGFVRSAFFRVSRASAISPTMVRIASLLNVPTVGPAR